MHVATQNCVKIRLNDAPSSRRNAKLRKNTSKVASRARVATQNYVTISAKCHSDLASQRKIMKTQTGTWNFVFFMLLLEFQSIVTKTHFRKRQLPKSECGLAATVKKKKQ